MSILFKHKVNWRYAIGEIILIFIGITLAIAFNNWNEGRMEHKQMQSHVKAIYTDLLMEQERLSMLIDEFRHKSDVSIKFMELIEQSEYTSVDSRSNLMDDISSIGSNVGIDRQIGTWDELKSTGKYQTLEDQILINMLTHHYQIYDRRINNYNRQPLDNLDLYKGMTGSLNTSSSLRQLSAGNYIRPYTLETLVKREKIYELLASIGIASILNSQYFQEIRQRAQSIISYMEENYADILE